MKKILLGVTGSIAAYKSAELVRLLRKSDYEVRVVMTKSATQFITPMTMQVLSQHEVRTDLFDSEKEQEIDHIALARWADCLLIAPCSANIIAKLASGIADDLLSTICLATTAPIVVAPAMNAVMWNNTILQDNVIKLQQHGINFIDTNEGEQACGEIGFGRMAEPVEIVDYISTSLTNQPNNDTYVANINSKSLARNSITTATPITAPMSPPKIKLKSHEQVLAGKNILITAGATIERIDPVRYLTNFSSGKMGFALANVAAALGAKVTLVHSENNLDCVEGIDKIVIESAADMYDAVLHQINTRKIDWFISTAAVADFRVKEVAKQKIKKNAKISTMKLELITNVDILESVCKQRNLVNVKMLCVGFAAETQNLIGYAEAKRIRKGADLICANDVSAQDIGFSSDLNEITVIGDHFEKKLAKQSKIQLAEQLLLIFNSYKKII